MAGYDDPRFLQQKIESLERQLDILRKATLTFSVHQKGAIPGYMRAVALNDQGQKGSMWMNFTQLGPGQGPYGAVTDPNGVIRAEWGNLAANGNSPAQEGFRANDANHVPIFDSLGLIAVMQQLGQTQTATQNVTSTTDVLLTGTPITLSLARPQNILVSVNVSANISSVASGSVDIFKDGTLMWGSFLQWAGTPTSTAALVISDFAAAGSHTYDLRGRVQAGSTLGVLGTVTTIWELGS